MTDLLTLATRVEQGSGADRALDYDVAHYVSRAHMETGKAPAYSSSLDAIKTLERELEAKGWRLSKTCQRLDGSFFVEWGRYEYGSIVHFCEATAPTEEAARLAAFLRALAAQEQNDAS